ncbi:hypothetical protein H8D73_02105 [bacterium]|nr:hypothetical protein [bacterium]
MYCSSGTGSLVNCIIAFSVAGEGVAADSDDIPTLTCCDVYGNIDGNYDANIGDQTGIDSNISVDPELCWFAIGDYRLFNTSPCLPGGHDCGVLLGAYSQGCDSPVEKTSWGRVKASWHLCAGIRHFEVRCLDRAWLVRTRLLSLR